MQRLHCSVQQDGGGGGSDVSSSVQFNCQVGSAAGFWL
jgi:hypothetical protein